MTDEKLVHLHNHSYYSLLDGLSSPEDLVKTAKNMGYKSLALTDHGTCAGLFKFVSVCKDNGIKPILGMEAYICPDHTFKDNGARELTRHLLLLAKNEAGYKNLIKLSTISYVNGFYYKPRIDFNLLEKHSSGLIVSSACCAGEIPNLLFEEKEQEAEAVANKYKEVFKDDFYIEIMLHKYYMDAEQEAKEKKLASLLYKFSKKLGIKAICTQDTHYARKEEWEAHDTLLSIGTVDTVKNPKRRTMKSKDFYLKPYEEMAELYKKVPELLLNTVEISEKIESNLMAFGQDLLPNFKVPEGFNNEEEYLKALVTTGMKEKGLIGKPEYRERIKYEMGVITKCKYTKYFVVLWDIINFAHGAGIRIGAGRGCFLPENMVDCIDSRKTISKVNIGDEVLSYDGKYHDVIDVLSYDIDEDIIEIEMEDGRKITCTLDHEIHVQRGLELVWIKAAELTEDDEIYDIREG